MKTHSLPIVATCLLFSQSVFGGLVTPFGNFGDWSNADDWNWRADDNSADSESRVPEEGDTVLLSTPGGVTMEIATIAPPMSAVYVGSPTATEEFRLELKSGAYLETRFLYIGRAGSEAPMGLGFVTVEEGVTLVADRTVIGAERGNNGHMEIRNGTFTTKELILGGSGTDGGSVLLVEGSKSAFAVLGDAVMSGASEDGSAAPLKLKFVFDTGGISPIEIGGSLRIERTPELLVDLTAFRPTGLPISFPLIEVEGGHVGEFAKPEIINLPMSTAATVEWTNETLMLKLSRR